MRVNSGSAPSAFFDILSEYRDQRLIYMDDWDTLLTNASNQALIKSAFGPDRRAVLQSVKLKNLEAKKGTAGTDASETDFLVSSKLVWLSNKNVEYFRANNVDLDAIFDRSFPPIFVTGSDVDLFRYVVYMTVWNGLGKTDDKGTAYDLKTRIESLIWYNENRNRTIKLSFRGIEDACDIIAHDPNKTKTLDASTNKKFEHERSIAPFTPEEIQFELNRQCRRYRRKAA